MIALLCSGQGSQHAGMFDLLQNAPAAQNVFKQATTVLGEDPRRLAREAPPEVLFSNRSGQVLCCTLALAWSVVLADVLPARRVVAGYSVGELAAWGCAGMLDSASLLQLAGQRAALMDAVAPADGAMAAILGLRREQVLALLDEPELTIAISNGMEHFVVAGHRPAITRVCEQAVRLGARRAVPLRVAVPSHSPLLAAASPRFSEQLAAADPRLPVHGCRVLTGVDGDTLWTLEDGIRKLGAQISREIHWGACLESCRGAGAVAALELGPGQALAHMAEAMFPADAARSVEQFRSIDGVRAWLARQV